MIPRRLPVVDLDGEAYFFDLRLSQLRKVDEPHDFIDLSANERRDFVEALLYLEVAQQYGGDPSREPRKNASISVGDGDSNHK